MPNCQGLFWFNAKKHLTRLCLIAYSSQCKEKRNARNNRYATLQASLCGNLCKPVRMHGFAVRCHLAGNVHLERIKLMQITYRNWQDEYRMWDTDNERYYLLLDKQVQGTDGSYLNQSAGFYAQTVQGVKTELCEWLLRFPAFSLDMFRAVNARIVKAPCAFDARTVHIIAEKI